MGDGDPVEVLRPMLFGNLPIDRWPSSDDGRGDGVVGRFVAAREALARGVPEEAVAIWREIATADGIEARHVLQAWCFLRGRGIQPDPSIAAEVLGVVVEIPIDDRHDVLAGYRDGTARYLNHSGRVAIVDDPTAFASVVAALVDAGQGLADRIGPWDRPELPPLPPGHARLAMLTREGFRFGQGPEAALLGDAIAQPVLAAATALLVAITSS